MSRIIICGVVALAIAFCLIPAPETTAPPKKTEVKIPEADSLPVSSKHEAFVFEKFVKVKFDFQDRPIEQGLSGYFFLEWETGEEKKHAVATVILEGKKSDVSVKAHFTEDYALRCLELPRIESEEEAHYVQLLQSLLLDYAFKTNRDANGPYEASLLAQEGKSGERLVNKTKARYLEKSELAVEKSNHIFRLKQNLLEAKGEEYISLTGAFTEMSYRLTRTEDMAAPRTRQVLEYLPCTQDFSQQLTFVEKLTQEELSAHLSKLQGSDRDGRHALMRKILKALKNSPEQLPDFMRWTRSIRNDRSLSSLAVGILGNLGTPEAQRELVSLYEAAEEESSHLQEQVLNAFTLTSAPVTPETREFLRTQVTEEKGYLAEGAAYALGSSIQNDPESSESKRDLDFLLDSLENSQTITSKMVYLDALGNSGSPEAAPVLERYSYSSDKFIREKAQMGLRSLKRQEI